MTKKDLKVSDLQAMPGKLSMLHISPLTQVNFFLLLKLTMPTLTTLANFELIVKNSIILTIIPQVESWVKYLIPLENPQLRNWFMRQALIVSLASILNQRRVASVRDNCYLLITVEDYYPRQIYHETQKPFAQAHFVLEAVEFLGRENAVIDLLDNEFLLTCSSHTFVTSTWFFSSCNRKLCSNERYYTASIIRIIRRSHCKFRTKPDCGNYVRLVKNTD